MSETCPKLICKNCGCDNHPHYDYKYDGFCLDCINAKADQHLDTIAELELQLAAATARLERMEAALTKIATEGWNADNCAEIARAALQPDARNRGEGE